MFPCACALRSTQCAALIALATAAGISRLEPTAPEMLPTAAPRRDVPADDDATRRPVAAFFHILHKLAPWLTPTITRADGASESCPSSTACEDGRAGHREIHAASPVGVVILGRPASAAQVEVRLLAPSAGNRSFPYAVGPPCPKCAQNERKVDTGVSGDSAARSMYVQDVATYSSFAPSRPSRERRPEKYNSGSIPDSELGPARRTRNTLRATPPGPTRADGGIAVA